MILARAGWRTCWLGLLGLLAAALLATVPGSAPVYSQPPTKKPVLSEEKFLTTSDGWQLSITYHKSPAGKESPVVLLLHNQGGNKLKWDGPNGYAAILQSDGYAVITVDLRHHGQSKPPAGGGPVVAETKDKKAKKPNPAGTSSTPSKLTARDHVGMVEDLETVKRFIYQEHEAKNLNMNKLAIVAPEFTAPIAVTFAHADWLKKPYDDAPTLAECTPRGQDVRAIVLVSPDENVTGLSTGRSLTDLAQPVFNVAFLIAYGKDDKLDKGQSKSIYRKLTGPPRNADRMLLQDYETGFRGRDLFDQRQPFRGSKFRIEDHVFGFLKKYVKDTPGEWRDRQSRLEK